MSLVAHLVTPLRWKGYSLLGLREQRQWCNRIACGLHVSCDFGSFVAWRSFQSDICPTPCPVRLGSMFTACHACLSTLDSLLSLAGVSCMQAALVVCCQVWHLRDPALSADPLHAVCPSHFLWGSVMYGYLAYDTVWTVVFPPAAGQGAFLVHHLVSMHA